MSEKWKRVAFADLIVERKGKYEPDSPEILELSKIDKIDFSEGKLHLSEYNPTKTKQIIVESGDFVFSGLNIEKGAAGFNETERALVVSANYSTCSYDDSQVRLDFFKHYMRSKNFQKLLKDNLKKDYGFTRPKHLLPLSFLVPANKSDQERIVLNYEKKKETNTALETEITHQKNLLGKLKKAILQEAIQGKLTADWRAANPDVEPASQLLNRIQAEKARLIAEKKIRKEKPLPKITPEEIPFEIPEGWEWCRITNATLTIVDCPHSTPKWTESGMTCVKTGQFQRFNLDLSRRHFVSKETYNERVKRLTPLPNDILYSREGGILGIACRIPAGEEICLGQRMMLLRPLDGASAAFIEMMLNAPHVTRIAEQSTLGGCAPHINVGEIKAFPIPLPPLAEQAAIVERVETLMVTCRAMETEIEHSRTHAADLLQAVLKEAFAPTS